MVRQRHHLNCCRSWKNYICTINATILTITSLWFFIAGQYGLFTYSKYEYEDCLELELQSLYNTTYSTCHKECYFIFFLPRRSPFSKVSYLEISVNWDVDDFTEAIWNKFQRINFSYSLNTFSCFHFFLTSLILSAHVLLGITWGKRVCRSRLMF